MCIGREVENENAISPDGVVVDVDELAQHLLPCVFGGVPEPSGANRVKRFGRIPHRRMARTIRARLDARLVGGRLWRQGLCDASNIGSRDGDDVSNVEERMRLQSMHETVDGVPIELLYAEIVAPQPDLVDRAVIGEKLGELAFEDGVVGRRAVRRFVPVQGREREADPDVGLVGRVDELADDVTLAALPWTRRYGIRGAPRGPQAESIVVLGR